MNTQWYDIATKVAQHTYGIVAHELPMVRYRDGRVARINTPPEGSTPRAAAVLVIITLQDDGAALVLTRRGGHLREHSGEISFREGASKPMKRRMLVHSVKHTKSSASMRPH